MTIILSECCIILLSSPCYERGKELSLHRNNSTNELLVATNEHVLPVIQFEWERGEKSPKDPFFKILGACEVKRTCL